MSTVVSQSQQVKALFILLVEDNPLDARVVTGLLRGASHYAEFLHVGNLADALTQLASRPADVVLLDLNLDDSFGYETFERVHHAAPTSAILVLSGSDDEELASRTVREGAQDYLVKGSFDGKLLLRAIRYALERKASEEALRKSEALARAIFENALDAIVICSESGRFVEANQAAAGLLGVPRASLVGYTICDFGGDGFEAEMSRMRAASSGRGKFTIRRRDGSQRVVDYCYKASILPGRHLGVMRDITEQQSLEEQLRQSQKMEAVGRLAGSVAHDFNNILGVITGYAELIELRAKDEAVISKATKILSATTKASSLTKQLLAFGRKQVAAPKFLNLADVITDVSSMVACLVGAETNVVVLSSKTAGMVYADQNQMEQVLLNLVANAHEAMPYGGTITIALDKYSNKNEARKAVASEMPPGDYVRLSVKDTGTGIAPEIRSRIFDPFFTTKKAGSGLGLSTVFGIVRQAGGYITVDSLPQKGSTFSIYLPVVAQVTRETIGAQQLTHDEIIGDETILLVDDEEEFANAAAEYLEQCGYKVLKARAAEEAVHLARTSREKISLLVTDIVMPGGSGRGLVDQIRQSHPETGILAISGYADDAVPRHGFLDSTSFLQKPFTLQSLGAKIRAMLNEAKPRV